MLLTNLFNIQNNLFQTIKYHRIFGIEDQNLKIGGKEVRKAVLFYNFSVFICPKNKLKDIFIKDASGIRLWGTTLLIPSDIIFFTSKFKGLRCLVSCKDYSDSKLNTSYEVKISENPSTSQYYFCISREEWEEIDQAILKCPNNIIIRFVIRIDNNEEAPILTIKCKDKNNIEIYRPFILEHNSEYLKRLIEDDICFYYECYTEMLFYNFPLMALPNSKLKLIYKEDNSFIFKLFDSYVRLFLYEPKYYPNFYFFDEFSIKLVAVHDEPTNTIIVKAPSQRVNSNIGLEWVRRENAHGHFHGKNAQAIKNQKFRENAPNIFISINIYYLIKFKFYYLQ